MAIKLNIGSGNDLKEGYVNIDHGDYGQEVKRDLEKYLPFNDCTVELVEARCVLEHISDLWMVLDECHRVLKSSGELSVVVPNGLSIAPDHVRYFNKKFFEKYITSGPDKYSFSDKHWKLISLSDDGSISAVLSPVKEHKPVIGTKLNLGCGQAHKPGYINADFVPPYDLKVDVRHGLPFSDKTLELIEADNLMEHLENDEFIFLLNECHRVLVDEGRLWFRVPDALNWPDGAMGDPTHKRFFTPRSFTYFTECPTHSNYGRSYGLKTWRQISLTGNKKFYEWTGVPKR